MDYGLLEASNDYGFSKNQLLYAIQSDIVNSVPGQMVVISNPNIHAKNVTLLTGNGSSVGYKDSKITIKAENINKLENLKILGSAKAGDLTWNEDGSVDVRRRIPLSLDLREGGTITLNKKTRNIFLVGTENTSFNFTSGFGREDSDIVLMTGNGISLPQNETDRIYAKDLSVYAGRGNIGSLDNYLRTKITGTLEANAGGSAFIDNLGDLTLVSAVTGADRRPVIVGINKIQPTASGESSGLFINNAGDIYMSTERGKDMGYLLGSSVNLKAFSLGKQEVPLRIYTNGGVLNLEARDAYLEGVGTGDPLQINRYIVNNITLKNPEQFIWSLDRSDALYKDIYEFYGIDWKGYTLDYDEFYQFMKAPKAADDLDFADQESEKAARRNSEGGENSQDLVIIQDDETVKIVENQW